jgi:acetyltransferase
MTMNIHNLDSIFKPRRIALVGVTTNPNGVGGKVLANLIGGGFRGIVYPVNPETEAVMGVPCFPSVSNLPRIPDLAVICTPAEQVPAAVRECGALGVRGVIIMTAGFKEIGQAGRLLEEQIKSEAARFDRMRILGPNCLGIIAPGRGLNATFALGMPKAGHVAFISQSGALCTAVLDWAMEGKIGFSHFVSIGNTIDVDFGDLIDYFGEDENTKSIILYIESIAQARRFMTAARAFARSKPILAIKAGRFPESAEVAASHTGAMAAEDSVYDAAFQRAGLARVFEMGDVFDCAELIGRNKNPRGPRLAIITNAGGPGVLATDALIAEAGQLASFAAETMSALNENLPPAWSHGNPVDVLGNASPSRVERAVQIVLKDEGVDAVLVILSPQAMTNPTAVAQTLGELSDKTPKPILAAWLGGKTMREGKSILKESGIAVYDTPEQAVRAFMTLVAYSRNLDILYETPKDVPIAFSYNREEIRSRFLSEHVAESGIISEDESKRLIDAYGIATTLAVPAKTSAEAVRNAKEIGYPVVLKVHSPDITHKSDVNGVALNLENEDMVRGAFESIVHTAQTMRPDARDLGVTV